MKLKSVCKKHKWQEIEVVKIVGYIIRRVSKCEGCGLIKSELIDTAPNVPAYDRLINRAFRKEK